VEREGGTKNKENLGRHWKGLNRENARLKFGHAPRRGKKKRGARDSVAPDHVYLRVILEKGTRKKERRFSGPWGKTHGERKGGRKVKLGGAVRLIRSGHWKDKKKGKRGIEKRRCTDHWKGNQQKGDLSGDKRQGGRARRNPGLIISKSYQQTAFNFKKQIAVGTGKGRCVRSEEGGTFKKRKKRHVI